MKLKELFSELFALIFILAIIAQFIAAIPAINGNRTATVILVVSIMVEIPGALYLACTTDTKSPYEIDDERTEEEW